MDCGSIFKKMAGNQDHMPDNVSTGKLVVFQKGLEIGDATGHRRELSVIFLGNFDIEPLSKLHDNIEKIHGIQVDLVPEIILVIDGAVVLLQKGVGEI